jgi:hypothetical protein
VLSNKFVQGSQRKNGSGNSGNSLMLSSKAAVASKYRKGDSVRSDCSNRNSIKSCDEQSTKDDTYLAQENSITITTATAPAAAAATPAAAAASASAGADTAAAAAALAAAAGDSGTARLLAPDV